MSIGDLAEIDNRLFTLRAYVAWINRRILELNAEASSDELYSCHLLCNKANYVILGLREDIHGILERPAEPADEPEA